MAARAAVAGGSALLGSKMGVCQSKPLTEDQEATPTRDNIAVDNLYAVRNSPISAPILSCRPSSSAPSRNSGAVTKTIRGENSVIGAYTLLSQFLVATVTYAGAPLAYIPAPIQYGGYEQLNLACCTGRQRR